MRNNRLTRGEFLRMLGLGSLTGTSIPAATRPNVLVIVTDDQGYADLSAYPHAAKDVATPNMNRLAAQGLLFSRAYVAAPVCSPSRAAWNTGRYHQRWDVHLGQTPGLPNRGKTMAEFFKGAGYVTGMVGKNDFGRGYHSQDGREYPLNHGYDEFLGFSSHAHDYFVLSEAAEKATPDPHGHSAALGPLFDGRGRRSFETGYLTEIFTDRGIQFLQRHRDKPFFLHMAYNAVHTLVHEVPDRYLKRFDLRSIPGYDPAAMGTYVDYYDKYAVVGDISDAQMRKYYLANLACLDDNIGRLLDAMDRLAIAGNTLVVFFSDNGGTQHGGGCNLPLRGTKSTTFEGGIRVPFAMRWPGQLPAGRTYHYRVSSLDVLPTCLEAAGIATERSDRLDGQSFLDAARTGAPSPTEARPLFWHYRDRWAVLSGNWKLVQSGDPGGPKVHQVRYDGDPAAPEPALFNLADDPSEQHDVSKDNPLMVERMKRMFEEWRSEMRREATRQ